MEKVDFLEAVRMFGQFGELGTLTDDIGELVSWIEQESVKHKRVCASLSIYWMDTKMDGTFDVYSVRYNLLWKDGRYMRHNPYLVMNSTAYKEWRQEHGVRKKYY